MARVAHSSKALKGMVSAICLVAGGLALAQEPVEDPRPGEPSADTSGLDLRPEDAPTVCDASRLQVRVAVSGHNEEGIVLVELYGDDADNFLSREGRLKRIRVPAARVPSTICFDVDGPGVYALAGYHDINGDRKLNRKWNRLPKEPFGLSNDPDLKLRKPRLYEAAFNVADSGADIALKLRRH